MMTRQFQEDAYDEHNEGESAANNSILIIMNAIRSNTTTQKRSSRIRSSLSIPQVFIMIVLLAGIIVMAVVFFYGTVTTTTTMVSTTTTIGGVPSFLPITSGVDTDTVTDRMLLKQEEGEKKKNKNYYEDKNNQNDLDIDIGIDNARDDDDDDDANDDNDDDNDDDDDDDDDDETNEDNDNDEKKKKKEHYDGDKIKHYVRNNQHDEDNDNDENDDDIVDEKEKKDHNDDGDDDKINHSFITSPLTIPVNIKNDKNKKENQELVCGYESTKQQDYRGRINVTRDGRLCQRWDSTAPHQNRYALNYYHDDYSRPVIQAYNLVSNYCRNPQQLNRRAWCYTTDTDKRWDYCNVPICCHTNNEEENHNHNDNIDSSSSDCIMTESGTNHKNEEKDETGRRISDDDDATYNSDNEKQKISANTNGMAHAIYAAFTSKSQSNSNSNDNNKVDDDDDDNDDDKHNQESFSSNSNSNSNDNDNDKVDADDDNEAESNSIFIDNINPNNNNHNNENHNYNIDTVQHDDNDHNDVIINDRIHTSTLSGQPQQQHQQTYQVVVPPLDMGPLVGHTTPTSVKLWAYHQYHNYAMEIILSESPSRSSSSSNSSTSSSSTSSDDLHPEKVASPVLYRINKNHDQQQQIREEEEEESGARIIRHRVMVEPLKEHNNAIIANIDGLEPNTAYNYEMRIHGDRVGKGRFRTAPQPQPPPQQKGRKGFEFEYILASCMNWRQHKYQPVWEEGILHTALDGKFPDFAILAGDTIYLHSESDIDEEQGGVLYDRVWYRHQQQRTEAHFAHFIKNIPMYAIWNDHDYGKNNADRYQPGKFTSLRAWQALWPNPGYGSPDPDIEDGIYYSFYWGDVHFIVTDDQWHREKKSHNRLGAGQTKWLEDELVHSTGIFKVIVMGSDIFEMNWEEDLQNIGTMVHQYQISGVLFHSGDIHRNEYKHKRRSNVFPYPVTQITSSGIAKVWRRPFVHIKVDTTRPDPQLTAYFYGATSKQEYQTTWENDPKLQCSSIPLGNFAEKEQRQKEHSCTETIRLSALTPPSKKKKKKKHEGVSV